MKSNKSSIINENNNIHNKRKILQRINGSKNKLNIDNNLDTFEALTPKRNIRDSNEEDEIEDDFVINNKFKFKPKESDTNLKQSIENKQFHLFLNHIICRKKIIYYKFSLNQYCFNNWQFVRIFSKKENIIIEFI